MRWQHVDYVDSSMPAFNVVLQHPLEDRLIAAWLDPEICIISAALSGWMLGP
jgi:hypothetical protein